VNWLIPPTKEHSGFCVGDQVRQDGEIATVIAVEDGYRAKYDHGLEPNVYVPVRESSGNVNGWHITRTIVVRRVQKMKIIGNELILEES